MHRADTSSATCRGFRSFPAFGPLASGSAPAAGLATHLFDSRNRVSDMSQTGRVSAKGTDTSASMAPAFSSVRNVVLVGHSGAGKTTLTECCWSASGTIPRAGSVTAGTTVSDFDPAEHRQQRSVSLRRLAPLASGEVKINLLDTPGYADFVGELRAGLRAADAALFVVSAVDAIDGATPDAVGRVRGRRHAAGHRRHQARLSPAADFAAAASRRARTRSAPGCSRCTSPDGRRGVDLISLLHTGESRMHEGRALGADRGDHRRERGRDPHGPLPRRRALDPRR